MKKIRIGKDFAVRWRIFVNRGEMQLQDLDKEKMSLVLVSPKKNRLQIRQFKLDGNLLSFRVYGWEMKSNCLTWSLGTYSLELTVNANDVGQSIVDCCNAFNLVGHSCEECGDSQDIEIATVLDLESSDLTLPYIASPFTIDDNGILTNRRNGKKYILTPYEEPAPQPPTPTERYKCYIGQVDATMSAFGQMSMEYMLSHAQEKEVSGKTTGSINATHSCIFFLVPSSLKLSSMSYVSGGLTTSITGDSLWNLLHDDITIDGIDYFCYGYRMATVSESDPQTYDYELNLA